MKRFLKWFVPIVVVFIILLWFGGRWILSFSTADYDGEIELNGIEDTVEVTYDEQGIPQIWAQSDADLYYTFGWLHASERLFQMELIRRLANGQLSAIFSKQVYQTDLRHRKIGFARKANQDIRAIDVSTLELLQQYCAGINAWVDHKSILPPEFVLLNFSPRRWKPEDCLAIALYQSWFAHGLMDRDREYQQLIDSLGTEIVPLLKEPYHWSPTTIDPGYVTDLFSAYQSPYRMSLSSNSWVVSPQKSASGAAIHASDPHLFINQIPGFWYIAGLHSREGINVLGVTTPGLPMVVMGHNSAIAFANTVASIDLIDYYEYQRHPQDSLQVMTENGYQKVSIIYEEIQVEGENEPRRVPIYFTPRGVVLKADSQKIIAMKWAGHDFNSAMMVKSGIELNAARNFEQFREAVINLGALDVNWVYSDAAGNIGYQLGAPVPKRNIENTFLRQSATDTSKRWQGYHDLEETPHMLNPQKGWLASCNNQIVPENWPYELPGFYDPYRIVRATELLSEKNRYSRKDFENMQLDRKSAIALRWKQLMARGAARLEKGDLLVKIAKWDGSMSKDSQIAGLFALWWEYLTKFIFEDELGKDWNIGKFVREEILTYSLENIIDDKRTGDEVETITAISATALEEALAKLGDQNYGDLCKLTLKHPLSRIKILDYWLDLNRGPYPASGDLGCLNANFTIFEEKNARFRSVVGPSMRFVLDWSDVDAFTINTNIGQSGNPFSPHYDDFFETMRKGNRWTVPFTREAVFRMRSSLLRLLPEKN